MDTKKQLSELLAKPMSRREFLAYLGTAVLAVIGISGFLKSISSHTGSSTQQERGYGSNTYGGKS